ncbi:hypothetical protein CDD82_1839 [Ophiocordyceps australis]|uniref:ABC1 atypical kinase-like domain-containing protein n=1 Tax=Ophiocordyceps australis TaxID=1399860 RepID=A0A2C5ZLX2_9HYPO|nr:hypothetical protein CDD82_1839 [Ophiocordyceps australis]
MKLADFVIDAAALLSASRSVAAKHAALRRQQLEAWSKTSSLFDHRKDSRGAEHNTGAQGNEAAASVTPWPAKEEQRATQQNDDTEAPPGVDLNIFNTVRGARMLDPLKRKTESKSGNQLAAEAASKEHPLRFWPNTSPIQVVSAASGSNNGSGKGKTLADATMSKDAWRRAPKPGGAARDESLGSNQSEKPTLADASMSKEAQRRAPKPESHEATEEPNPTLADASMSKEAQRRAPKPESHKATKEPHPTLADASMSKEATRRAPKPESNAPDGKVKYSSQVEEAEGASKIDPETFEIAEALLSSTEAPSTRTYQLRESKVPSSRFGRLWNYGGLAAGMLGGAMSEGVSRVFGGGGQGSVLLSEGNMERLVSKLSRMRGAALKFGQMMSFQDSKMLPAPLQEVLQRVQDRADYMPAWQRDAVLTSNLGSGWRDLFSDFEEKPLAAASIGQVHKAVLRSNGRPVAVKIQFPGVAASIDSDLDNLSILLNATSLLPKGLYLDKTLENARLELGWECDYEREAACARRYKELLARSKEDRDTFAVPDIYSEASGKQVLTMDLMDGVGVTRVKGYTQAQRDWVGTHIMRLCLREIAQFHFMQTDPNWTNFLFQLQQDDAPPKHRLALLDFGASREYPERFVRLYISLLDAAARADRDAVCVLSQELGYLTGHESRVMRDAHIDSILTLAEPFFANAPPIYDFKGQTITERVKALIPVMLRERLAPPPEETYSLHRKLSGAFLLCARLGSRVPCRELFVGAVGAAANAS